MPLGALPLLLVSGFDDSAVGGGGRRKACAKLIRSAASNSKSAAFGCNGAGIFSLCMVEVKEREELSVYSVRLGRTRKQTDPDGVRRAQALAQKRHVPQASFSTASDLITFPPTTPHTTLS